MVIENVIESWKSKVFQWGKSDCSSFANDAIEAMTGRAFLKPGEYRFYSEQELNESFDAKGMIRKFRELFTKAGMRQSDFPEREAIGIINLGKSIPALSVWDGARLWAISKKGLRAIDQSLVVEWWEPAENKNHG